jgi:hypothetical protein
MEREERRERREGRQKIETEKERRSVVWLIPSHHLALVPLRCALVSFCVKSGTG